MRCHPQLWINLQVLCCSNPSGQEQFQAHATYKCIPHADAISTPSQQSKQYSSTTTAEDADDAATESADAASHDAFDWQDLDKLSGFRTVQ